MSAIHCFFCGGKECKYENWRLWTFFSYKGTNAFDGLFSTWITDDILAHQRPSTKNIKEFNIIDKFIDNGIRAIFNLQLQGEHAYCGEGNETISGFSYIPQHFMDKNISYYNLGWADMDVPDFETMQNIVTVMYKTRLERKKFSVHCHAGLGRTGLAIACYLVSHENYSSQDAINLIRKKRPLSIQTSKQAEFVTDFKSFQDSLKLIFTKHKEKRKLFEEYLWNQRYFIDNESHLIKSIPKVINTNRLCLESLIFWWKDAKRRKRCPSAKAVYSALKVMRMERMENIQKFKYKWLTKDAVNSGNWDRLELEKDVSILVELLLDWILKLQEPLISNSLLLTVESNKGLGIEGDLFETLNYILEFVRLMEKPQIKTAIERFSVFMTSHRYNLEFSGPKPTLSIISKVGLVVADTKRAGGSVAEQGKKAGIIVAEQGMKAGLAVAEKGMKAGLVVAEQGGKLFNSLRGLYSLSAKDSMKETKGSVVTKAQNNIKILEGPTLEHQAENISDYEPPPLDKLVEFITNMIEKTAVSNFRAISVESGKLISVVPDFITPQEFMSRNPLGTTDNLTLLLKTNSPGIPDIISYKDQAMLYIDPLQKFIVRKSGVFSSSNPELHVEDDGEHVRVGTVSARIEVDVSASTSPKDHHIRTHE